MSKTIITLSDIQLALKDIITYDIVGVYENGFDKTLCIIIEMLPVLKKHYEVINHKEIVYSGPSLNYAVDIYNKSY